MKTDLEILTSAREILTDPNHWYQGDFTNEQGAYCVLGACYKTVADDLDADFWDFVDGPAHAPERQQVVSMLHESVEACLSERGKISSTAITGLSEVPDWNDDPYTTHKDVLDVLDCGIRRLERKT